MLTPRCRSYEPGLVVGVANATTNGRIEGDMFKKLRNSLENLRQKIKPTHGMPALPPAPRFTHQRHEPPVGKLGGNRVWQGGGRTKGYSYGRGSMGHPAYGATGRGGQPTEG